MTPIDDRRDLLATLARLALGAVVRVVPADFRNWCTALDATTYGAWRQASGEISVYAVGEISGRHIRITATCRTAPTWMGVDTAAALPEFDSPAPPAVLPFPDAA